MADFKRQQMNINLKSRLCMKATMNEPKWRLGLNNEVISTL